MDAAEEFVGGGVEIVEVAAVVCFGEEAGFSVVAALDDVLWDAGKREAGFSRHGGVSLVCGADLLGVRLLAKNIL